MIYGYARCSTNEDRQDVNRQIRELKATGKKEIFRTTKERYVPEGWEQVDLIETFTIGGPLQYRENNPYIKAKREKEAR